MEIQEWRNGKKIGVVVRDIQINVYDTDNKPPVIGPLSSRCVEAGSVVDFLVSATDPNNDLLRLSSTSGIYSLDPCRATFTKVDSVEGFYSSRFRWETCYEAVRNQPYDIIIKADDYNSDQNLSDIDNFQIKVLGPSPVLTGLSPAGKFMRLEWNDYGTDAIMGFNIYRREGSSSFTPDTCMPGIPASAGYEKVGYIEGNSTVSYLDTNSGEGLEFNKEYSYRITAVFKNLAESKASNELVSSLVSGIPLITNVSVRSTSATNGSIVIRWRRPDRLDTIPAPGPWEYIISRADGVTGTNYTRIRTISTSTLNETSHVDTLINTVDRGYIYRIELYNNTPGNRFLIGEPGYASSLYLTANPGDRKVRFVISRNVPWVNTRYDFFRLNRTTMAYDSIGTSNILEFTDTGLENGTEYCYMVRSTGGYASAGMPGNLLNFSSEPVIPVDNEAPCQPALQLQASATASTTMYAGVLPIRIALMTWQDAIYYKLLTEEPMSLLTVINDRNTFSYNIIRVRLFQGVTRFRHL